MNSIRTKLTAAFLAVLLPVLVIQGLAVYGRIAEREAAVMVEQVEVAQTWAMEVERYIQSFVRAHAVLAAAVDAKGSIGKHGALEMVFPGALSTAILEPDGAWVAGDPLPVGINGDVGRSDLRRIQKGAPWAVSGAVLTRDDKVIGGTGGCPGEHHRDQGSGTYHRIREPRGPSVVRAKARGPDWPEDGGLPRAGIGRPVPPVPRPGLSNWEGLPGPRFWRRSGGYSLRTSPMVSWWPTPVPTSSRSIMPPGGSSPFLNRTRFRFGNARRVSKFESPTELLFRTKRRRFAGRYGDKRPPIVMRPSRSTARIGGSM